MKQTPKTITDFEAILNEVRFDDYSFIVSSDNEKVYLQAEFNEPDVLSGEILTQKTRKWILSPWMTKSEIVFTAFKCVLTSVEHETRERFTYRGQRICSPHFDVDALADICLQGKFDERDDWYSEQNKN